MSVYVHIAIIRKRLHIEESLHTILQILSLTMFEKIPLKQLLNTSTRPVPAIFKNKHLNLGITCESAQVEGGVWQMPSGEWKCVDLSAK